ncbi:MAG: TadE/TadG family type IV pilus assembly protein [Trebonia sp.]
MAPGRRDALRRRLRSDRGSSAVELAFLAPAFLGVIMLVVQFGLWFNARQIALAAAQAGARVAREEAGDQTQQTWEKDATNASESYYRSLNTHLLGSLTATPEIVTTNGAQAVGIKVSGPLGYSVFSWFNSSWTVTETVTGPVECFYPVGDTGKCSPPGTGAPAAGPSATPNPSATGTATPGAPGTTGGAAPSTSAAPGTTGGASG